VGPDCKHRQLLGVEQKINKTKQNARSERNNNNNNNNKTKQKQLKSDNEIDKTVTGSGSVIGGQRRPNTRRSRPFYTCWMKIPIVIFLNQRLPGGMLIELT
jgi:hypothetical protein